MGRQVPADPATDIWHAEEQSVRFTPTPPAYLYPTNLSSTSRLIPSSFSSRYVNYATGDEAMEEMYGYDEDRLKRLRAQKAVWDPEERFSHYHPIH
jgi:hypothetical protein